MDAAHAVNSTAEAAFAADENGRIVAWNRAVEELLGFASTRILGEPCYEVLCGLSVFGNTFCQRDCTPLRMARTEMPLHPFELTIRSDSGERMRAVFSVLAIRTAGTGLNLVHLVRAKPKGFGRTERPTAGATDGPQAHGLSPALTSREVAVLCFLADGLSTHEIADALSVSILTVRTHVRNALHKLGAHTRHEAIALAIRHDLI